MSEIVGLDARIGKKVGSRLDPLEIEREAVDRQIYVHRDPDQVWTLDRSNAAETKKGEPQIKGDGRPSEINHGNIAPSVDSAAGGVTISQAVQTTVISLAALRRLRFAGHGRSAETAARTAVAALGVASIAYQHAMDFDLRSRCLLIPEHSPRIELVGRNGAPAEVVDIDRQAARDILDQASAYASAEGIGWETNEIRLVPAPKLIELITRSRAVSAVQQPSG